MIFRPQENINLWHENYRLLLSYSQTTKYQQSFPLIFFNVSPSILRKNEFYYPVTLPSIISGTLGHYPIILHHTIEKYDEQT